jgi:hypothetical protein
MRVDIAALITTAVLAAASPARTERLGPAGDLQPGEYSLAAQSFETTWGTAADDDHFRGAVAAAPTVEIAGRELRVRLGSHEVRPRVLARRGPCTTCVRLDFELFAQRWGQYPEQGITMVEAVFDTGEVATRREGNVVVIALPERATRLRRLEVTFSDARFERTLVWDDGGRVSTRVLAVGGAILAAAGGLVIGVRARRRRRDDTGDERITADVTGQVVRLDGAPAAGLPVALEGEGRKYAATTSAEGRYLLGGVAPGAYVLTIDATGFRWVRDEVVVAVPAEEIES